MINQVTDFSLPGVGVDLRLERTYRSQMDFSGLFGYGWRSKYDINLMSDIDGNVTIFNKQGVAIYFYNLGSDIYIPAPGNHSSLVKNSDGTFTLTNKHGIITNYSLDGRLSIITDRNGNTLRFVFDPLTPGGTYIEDASGRKIILTLDAIIVLLLPRILQDMPSIIPTMLMEISLQ